MSIKSAIVRTLLLAYPAAWRREYGTGLAGILLARPLSAAAIVDVLWNAGWQRARIAEPWTLCGLGAMLVVLTGLVWNLAAPPPDGHGLAAVLRASSMTLPTVIVSPLASDLYAIVLVACGCWTRMRHGGTPSHSGVAAMKATFIAGLPVMLAGALMLLGVLGVAVLAPGNTPAAIDPHGLAYTYLGGQRHTLTPLAVLTAPLFRLPGSWIWGAVGGVLGQYVARGARRQTARA